MQHNFEIEEQLCDIGAAELLMPAGIFERYAEKQSIQQLSRTFGVSEVFIRVRLAGGPEIREHPRALDPRQYMADRIKRGRPVVIVWHPNTERLHTRRYRDVFGVTDEFGTVEVPTLFAGTRLGIKLIPYLVVGYDVPPELEGDTQDRLIYEEGECLRQ